MPKHSFIIAVAMFGLGAGIAQAAPAKCVAMHKELTAMGEKLQLIPAQQAELASAFDQHDAERASAEADLSNLELNISVERSREELVQIHETSLNSANMIRQKLDALNSQALTLSEQYQSKASAFNEACAG